MKSDSLSTSSSSPFRIVIGYILFGGLWILFSDLLVEQIVPVPFLATVSIAKGWLFIALTALLLYHFIGRQLAALGQMTAESRANEERLKQLGNNLPDSYVYQYLHEMDGTPRFLYLSAGVEKLHGVNRQDVLCDARILLRQVAPEQAPILAEAEKTSLQEMTDFMIELRICRADGELRWLKMKSRPIRRPDGQVLWDGVVTDITERKQAEEELRISNEELLAINRIITTTTTTTTTAGVNEILEKVMDEALNISGLEGGTICLVTPDERLHLAAQRETSDETVRDLTENVVKVGECLCGESVRDHRPLILKDKGAVLAFASREATRGEDIRFHAAFPLLAGGRCLGVLCVFTRTDFKPAERTVKLLETASAQIAIAVDNAQMFEKITHHAKKLEDTVRERTVELEENQTALLSVVEDLNLMTDVLKAANERLKGVDRLKSMFIASMSHELRTPLNSIIGFTSIILQGMAGDISEEQRDHLQRVLKAGRHLLSLVTDVIDVSKIESGKIDAYVEEFSLDTLLNDALSNLKLQIKEKGLEIEVSMIPESIFLKTDRKRLLQCLLNYLSNAVKFTEKGGITILAEEKSDYLELKVTDTGIGIRSADLPLLFQSFVRLESPLKMTVTGTGLGLYLTKKLAAEVLGGEVSVTSEYGKGSTFGLRIPKCRMKAEG